MKQIAETIYNPMNEYDELTPVHQMGTTTTYYQGFTLGDTTPTGWTGFNALGGCALAQGTGAQQRVGSYAYLKKGTLTMSIDMKPNTTSNSGEPCEFRVIMFKARPSARQFGQTYTPDNTLFLNTSGNEIGTATSGVKGADMMLQPLNARRWNILRQQKFILSNANATSVLGPSQSYYPSRKILRFNMPFWKKVKFNSSNEPQDVDIHYAVLVICTPIAKFSPGNRWEMNTRGTCTFNDI